MGIQLTPPAKTVASLFNEAWATTIQSAVGPGADLLADPMITIHFRERTIYSDGTSSATNDLSRTTPNFVAQISFRMSSIVVKAGTLAYKDVYGADHTIPTKEVPYAVKAFLDLMGGEARQARADELAAEAARLAAVEAARLLAEAEEAARLLAEQEAEAARLLAEQEEAARILAEQEANNPE